MSTITDKKITDGQRNAVWVQHQQDRLTGTPQQNKAVFDEYSELIREHFNEAMDVLDERISTNDSDIEELKEINVSDAAESARESAEIASESAQTTQDMLGRVISISNKIYTKSWDVEQEQDEFVFSAEGYTYNESDTYEVFVNGLKLSESEYTRSEDSVVLGSSISAGNTVEIIVTTNLKGKGIADTQLNDDYTLTIHYDDGTSTTTESIRGEKGEKGDTGDAVADGSLTEVKFTDALKKKTIKDYVTPEMFGAVGDGVHDDTNALRDAVYYSHTNGNILFFPNDKKYYVTGSLNYYNSAYYDCKLNVLGCNPTKHGEYALSTYGGIIVSNDVHLFNGKTISGCIRNLSIVGETRDTDTAVFYKCTLSGLTVYGCNMSQFGAICVDTGASSLTAFDSNKFLTAYYFAKFESAYKTFTDSTITNNYINGGAELNDNACFEWVGYNGSLIQGNFIDYYQCIFRPKAQSSVGFNECVSQGNQYQVFRYFYWFDSVTNKISSAQFMSIGDVFNWTKESTLEKLQTYAKYTYTDKDGNTVIYPPYIFGYIRENDLIRIKDAIIENNVAYSDLVVIGYFTFNYSNTNGEFSCNIEPTAINSITLLPAKSGRYNTVYNWGEYPHKKMKIDVVLKVDTLPYFETGWSKAFAGMKVLYNNVIYTATVYYDGSAWKAKWLDQFGNAAN